ncbi:MAG: Succinyl-CoA ligase (ADP-forming) subunit beta [bacterium ADurb.Bin431]|nr:MAG: Succinyl-CoA ligase (ADP-forming) subunit beta [bacterium ADurb.Bin431]
MKIHEYQAKELLARYGIPVQRGAVAFKPREVRRLAEKMALKEIVLKAQVHAGGRGKAGGIKLLHSPAEAEDAAAKMFGMRLVTPQTGAEGKIVRRILVTEAAEISRELYAGIVLDRARRQLVFMVSQAGGVEIEKVAEESPEKIIKEYVDRAAGLQPFQARRMAFALGLTGPLFREGVRLLLALYEACIQCDASLLEINPLVVTPDQKLLALDVKLNVDDNALFRHPDIQEMRDTGEEDPLEVEASSSNLNYIKLDGNVGCMVNGAGLAMATMDIIKLYGRFPANFLDVGGGASKEKVTAAFKIITADPKVKGILINIFGGIMKCDVIAEGVVAAVKEVGLQVPLVVRLEGTNVELGKKIINESGLNVISADDLEDAARKIVAAVKG